jgi:hypothetical protein
MTYSSPDFVDSILRKLGIEVPEEAYEDTEAQAELALIEIARLQEIEQLDALFASKEG